MSWHTVAWTKSVAASTLEEVTPVTDGIISIINSHFMFPSDKLLIAGVALATDLQRVQITTPTLRQVAPIFVRPIQPTLIGANDANQFRYEKRPVRIRGREEIVLEAFQDNAGAQRVTVVGCFMDRMNPLPPGDIYTIRATSTTAVTANVWSQITPTFASQLPAGRYAVAGLEHISANGQACRLTFDGQYERPGVPSISDVNQRVPNWWNEYPFGSLGTFDTITLPRIEVLANGADAVHEVYLSVIPLAA